MGSTEYLRKINFKLGTTILPKIQINNINLYYETIGQGDSILFIHGLGSSTRDWELQTAFFSKHYRVTSFDVRGHGQSDKPPGPYSIPLFTSDTIGLIKTLDIAPSHIIGISMGAMIAFQLVIDEPDLVKSLVIVNATPELKFRTLKEKLDLFKRLLIVKLLGMKKIGTVLAARLFPMSQHENQRQIFAERWAQNDKRAYLDTMKGLVGWSVMDKIGNINCPVQIIAADEDYTPIETKKSYALKLKNVQINVIKNSRHAVPMEHPDVFNQTIESFLTNI